MWFSYSSALNASRNRACFISPLLQRYFSEFLWPFNYRSVLLLNYYFCQMKKRFKLDQLINSKEGFPPELGIATSLMNFDEGAGFDIYVLSILMKVCSGSFVPHARSWQDFRQFSFHSKLHLLLSSLKLSLFLSHSYGGTSHSGNLDIMTFFSIMVNHSTLLALVNLSLIHTGSFHCLQFTAFYLPGHLQHWKPTQSSSKEILVNTQRAG